MSEFETQKQPEPVSGNLSHGINRQNLDPSAINNWGNGSNGREELIMDVNVDKNPEGVLTPEDGVDIFAARRARQIEYENQPGKIGKFERFLRAIGAKAAGK